MSGRKTFEILIKRLSLLSFFAVSFILFFLIFSFQTAEASTIKAPPSNLGLIGYWSMNEGSGTIAGDFSGNGHSGTLTGANGLPTWTTGKRDGALNFDGVDDYLDLGANLTQVNGQSKLTISGWVKLDSISADGALFNKRQDNSSWIIFQFQAASIVLIPSTTASFAVLSKPATVTNWTHYTMIFDGTQGVADDRIKLYMNGVVQTLSYTGTLPTTTASPTASSYLGFDPGNTNYIDGQMDEIRIYNRALSTAEITQLYDSGLTKVGIASSTGSLATGLVGHWTLDGKNVPWTSAIAGTALDSSGNSHTGTLTNMARTTSPTRGTVGQALSFDGSDDYVDRGTGPTSVNSVAFWVYPETTTEYFINLTSTSDYIWANAGTVTATGFTSPTIYVDGAVSSTLVANRWQHVVVTSSTSENASNLDIGRTADVNYLQGKMDDVRMYSRVITAAEIKRLYNIGRPSSITIPASSFNPAKLGGLRFWLKADAITGLSDGATIPASGWLDQSGHNMNFKPFGTTTITYETNEINGKPAVYFHGDSNGGLQTDGGEDLNDITGDFSIFAVWKLDVDFGPDMVFHKGDAATAAGSKFALLAHWNGDDRGAFNYYVGTSGANPQFTDEVHTWRQGNGVRNGSSANVRINRGEQTASATLAGTINSVTGYKATIGGLSTGTFPPKIHIAEVIFYDRAITGTNLTSIETYLFDKYGL